MKPISTDGLLRAILVIWLGGLLSCGEAPLAADRWFVGWLISESSDLNTTAQSSAHSNPHAFRVRGDSLEWITFASPSQMRSFSREMFPISRRSDTLWLPPDFSEYVSYLLLSDTFATVVDSQHHLRLAERDFLPVRPTEESVSLPKLVAELQSSAYQILSPDQHIDLAVLDESRVALRDGYDSYQEVESYYLSNIAGGTFLVLDNEFAVRKVQIVNMDTDSIRGYLYGAFGGPVVLQRLRDPVVNGALLLGSWEFDGIYLSGSDDSNAVTPHPPIQSITVTDSTFAYRLADRWLTYPFELIESTGMILLPDDRLWLVTALNDSLLEVIPHESWQNRFRREHKISFRRVPQVGGVTEPKLSGCSFDFLGNLVDRLPHIADGDVASFLQTPPTLCPANVEYAEWYNEVLFAVLAARPDSFRAIFRSLPMGARQDILAELRDPIHDSIDLAAILKSYRRFPGVMNDPIEKTLSAAIEDLN